MSTILEVSELPDLDPDSPVPVYRQLAGVLKDAILREQLAVGDQLPPESQLRLRYQLANATVRHAIDYLREEGYVQAQHGRGVFVQPYVEKFTVKLLPAAARAREAAATLSGLSQTDATNRALQLYGAIVEAVVDLNGDPVDDEVELIVRVPGRSKRKQMRMTLRT
jgi:DNA-binding transcriptional regulator YhcF (GntR family)